MTSLHHIRPMCCSFLLCLVYSSLANADVIISVPDVQISPGGTGFVDVLISTTGGDNIDAFNYEFEIAPVSATTVLQITGIEGGVLGSIDPNYVFAAGTNDGQLRLDGGPFPTTSFIGGDGTNTFVGVAATNALLTRINFAHDAGPGTLTSNQVFSLSLVDDGDTFFDDDNVNPLDFNIASGTIVAAVPEPSTCALLGLGTAVFFWRRRRANA